MNTIQQLKDELKEEFQITKRFFDTYPEEKNEYAPHEKSMKLKPLANHISEVFAWPEIILATDKLDFAAGDYQPAQFDTKEGMLKGLEENYQKGIQALDKLQDESEFDKTWGIYMGPEKLADWSKYGAIRHGLNQITHHRAQLGTYYRLNDIPVPGSYGPSADVQKFS